MPNADRDTAGGSYCRKCGYDLRGQVSPYCCPECGQGFDPADRKTFRTRPPREAGWRWAKRGVMLLLAVCVLLGMGWGWWYWGWRNEQEAVGKLKFRVMLVEPLGGNAWKRYLGPAGYVLDRVRSVERQDFPSRSKRKGETSDNVEHSVAVVGALPSIGDIKRLRRLGLWSVPVSESELASIKELRDLEYLVLFCANVTDSKLTQISGLKGLQHLDLTGNPITDAGVAHLRELRRLKKLILYDIRISDLGLIQIKELKELQSLGLAGTDVTDAGLLHLMELKGLKRIDLNGTKVTGTGVKKLREALPGALISWP